MQLTWKEEIHVASTEMSEEVSAMRRPTEKRPFSVCRGPIGLRIILRTYTRSTLCVGFGKALTVPRGGPLATGAPATFLDRDRLNPSFLQASKGAPISAT
jgi:hypothetical protein